MSTTRSPRRLRIALGTWVAIEPRATNTAVAGEQAAIEQAAVKAAYAAIGVVEQTMHPTRPGSELSRINTVPLNTPIQVQPDIWHLLQLAQRLHSLTDGVFDPCLPEQPGRLSDVELRADSMLVCHAHVTIDLGGMAKGHAIDRAIETLSEHGCTSGLVNAGGDLRVFGDYAETILLRQSQSSIDAMAATAPSSVTSGPQEFVYHPIQLQNAALAVSDLDATDRPIEHQGYYNHTGREPVRRFAAVIAKQAAIADALTKCVLLCNPELATRVLREFDATAPAPGVSWDCGRAR
jgi:thiamine biosynthesis lipoprotein